MSVSATGGPAIGVYPGYGDPRMPIGNWHADIAATGDASAGTTTMVIEFRGAADPPLFLAFSLDRIEAERIDGTIENPSILITNFSRISLDSPSQDYVLNMVATLQNDRVVSLQYQMGEMFLGVGIRGFQSAITAVFATNTNTVAYSLRASGQIWLYEGMNDLGGPQQTQSSVPSLAGPSKPGGSLQEVRSGMTPSVIDASGLPVAAPTKTIAGGIQVVQTPQGLTIRPPAGVVAKTPVPANTRPGPSLRGPTAGPTGITPNQASDVRVLRALTSTTAPLRSAGAIRESESFRRSGESSTQAVSRAQAVSKSDRGRSLRSASATSTNRRSAVYED